MKINCFSCLIFQAWKSSLYWFSYAMVLFLMTWHNSFISDLLNHCFWCLNVYLQHDYCCCYSRILGTIANYRKMSPFRFQIYLQGLKNPGLYLWMNFNAGDLFTTVPFVTSWSLIDYYKGPNPHFGIFSTDNLLGWIGRVVDFHALKTLKGFLFVSFVLVVGRKILLKTWALFNLFLHKDMNDQLLFTIKLTQL